MNWTRWKRSSSDRASAFASTVFPTPGTSSTSTWPSANRQSSGSRSVSCEAWTAEPRFSTTTRRERGRDLAGRVSRSSAFSLIRLLEQPLDLVEDRAGDRTLRRLPDGPIAVVTDEHDLVVLAVEADVVAAHVVVDDEIDVLVRQHRPLACETVPSAPPRRTRPAPGPRVSRARAPARRRPWERGRSSTARRSSAACRRCTSTGR